MNGRLRTITVLALAAIVVACGDSCAQTRAMNGRVGVLPVVAREGGAAAVDTVTALLADALRRRGHTVLVDADLRPTLRRLRVRSLRGVGREEAATLARELGLTHLMLAAVEEWSTGPLPSVGLTARLVRPGDAVVADAATATTTRDDLAGPFGTGRIDDPAGLAAAAVDELAASLDFATTAASPLWTGPVVAVVPLDATGGDGVRADAATSWLLCSLAERGARVLEPGVMNETLYALGRAPRGGVDQEALRALRETAGVDLVLTGSVDVWESPAGDPTTAVPRLAWGLRLLDAVDMKIVATFERELDGRVDETLFARGRIRSVGGLARRAAADVAASEVLTIEPDPTEVLE